MQPPQSPVDFNDLKFIECDADTARIIIDQDAIMRL